MSRDREPNRVPGVTSPGPRRDGAVRIVARALVGMVAIAAAAMVTTRVLRPAAAPRARAFGTALTRPGPAGAPCADAVDVACARAVGTRVGVTVAWLPDGSGWRSAGMRAGGSGTHGWATETLHTDRATLTITSNSPAVETGEPVAVPGTEGLSVRVTDAGHRVELVWSRADTRYVAVARADSPAALRDLGSLVDTWRRVRYASPVTGWS